MNQHVPLLGQQKQVQQAQIQAAINGLSLQIYAHLATGYIVSRDEHMAVEPERLRQLARDSATAAVCYFEGVLVKKEESDA